MTNTAPEPAAEEFKPAAKKRPRSPQASQYQLRKLEVRLERLEHDVSVQMKLLAEAVEQMREAQKAIIAAQLSHQEFYNVMMKPGIGETKSLLHKIHDMVENLDSGRRSFNFGMSVLGILAALGAFYLMMKQIIAGTPSP